VSMSERRPLGSPWPSRSPRPRSCRPSSPSTTSGGLSWRLGRLGAQKRSLEHGR
jgi:hypothetical protein